MEPKSKQHASTRVLYPEPNLIEKQPPSRELHALLVLFFYSGGGGGARGQLRVATGLRTASTPVHACRSRDPSPGPRSRDAVCLSIYRRSERTVEDKGGIYTDTALLYRSLVFVFVFVVGCACCIYVEARRASHAYTVDSLYCFHLSYPQTYNHQTHLSTTLFATSSRALLKVTVRTRACASDRVAILCAHESRPGIPVTVADW